MANVTIFGAGNMGTAIDEVLTAGGSTVITFVALIRRDR